MNGILSSSNRNWRKQSKCSKHTPEKRIKTLIKLEIYDEFSFDQEDVDEDDGNYIMVQSGHR